MTMVMINILCNFIYHDEFIVPGGTIISFFYPLTSLCVGIAIGQICSTESCHINESIYFMIIIYAIINFVIQMIFCNIILNKHNKKEKREEDKREKGEEEKRLLSEI